MRALLVLFSPVLITAAAALVATPFLLNHGERLNRARIPRVLLVAAIAMAPVAWAVIELAPDYDAFGGDTCADLDGVYETIVSGLFFWCGFVGGIAAAARYAVARPSVEMPIYYALATVIASYVIGLGIAKVAFCGWN